MATKIHCDIVSAEKSIFSGDAEQVIAAGTEGDLGIRPGHAPLLTELAPGPVRVIREDGREEVYYVSGGFLEIQPDVVSLLADTAMRARDIDEAEAERAREEAQRELSEHESAEQHSIALAQFAEASAKLRALHQLRRRS
ncbi:MULTISPECIES: F0F1 ATP synthase subunit epsilon [Larsenimonas]|uniref:ATP synthase epsilon chain n=1 Tax=Larsenimonas suaedae TaxID=1851019 RepID=A0ABU1GR17_9GAMM|nr:MULTISPECIES: F0F1 ATP synthase subunit epsilon [Larsenimonas]MCM2972730.1 F0F1 ATP synthase subunit epsilon [Larsenimonas suaedae]MCM5704710.1 F0F1 ATP synthase subunit epsilon [Larsenimonas salina]MDR5894473.1 F0F1 ATP synthase subunit epsilon [Larsenimonas suaedae]